MLTRGCCVACLWAVDCGKLWPDNRLTTHRSRHRHLEVIGIRCCRAANEHPNNAVTSDIVQFMRKPRPWAHPLPPATQHRGRGRPFPPPEYEGVQ
jgi:hypothetical protein